MMGGDSVYHLGGDRMYQLGGDRMYQMEWYSVLRKSAKKECVRFWRQSDKATKIGGFHPKERQNDKATKIGGFPP